ncbi:MAG TPA: ATPase domain-containing protein, partial [Puia sp.]
MPDVTKSKASGPKLSKSPTGIGGLDDITMGGLPKNRPTILLGNTGCGKTIMAMQFLVNGIIQFDEPGIFMAFEENTEELIANVKSLGYNLNAQITNNKIYLEHVQINRRDVISGGKYSIEGLFVRLKHAIEKIKAKRLVLDSLDTLFYGLDSQTLRPEIKRLFSWLKEKKITAIITAEMGNTFFTRNGVEEYVADCVILLDNRVSNQIANRRLRIIKYRGSIHGNNEYPFIIDERGISVFPIISQAVQQKSGSTRISSGIK